MALKARIESLLLSYKISICSGVLGEFQGPVPGRNDVK